MDDLRRPKRADKQGRMPVKKKRTATSAAGASDTSSAAAGTGDTKTNKKLKTAVCGFDRIVSCIAVRSVGWSLNV